MEVSVEYGGGSRFVVMAGTHAMICDQAVTDGGMDEGMSPPELLLASLGTCAGYYASQYLKARDLPSGVRVDVSAEKLQSPPRLGMFRVRIVVEGELEARHRLGISRAVNTCLIHNTFALPPKIDVTISASR
jgi:uncharacterized OsmC-like protein